MSSQILHVWRLFLRSRAGSIQIMGAFMILAAMGVGAVSVDLISTQSANERLEIAATLTCERIERADNAVYRNSSDLAAAAQQFIEEQLNRSKVGFSSSASVTVKRPEKNGEPISSSELQVAVSGEVETIMAKALGLASGKIDVVLLCQPTPPKPTEAVCSDANKAFLVMTSVIGDRITLRSLRSMSKTSHNTFVMTLTDDKNIEIIRTMVTRTLDVGTVIGNRTLLETDRLHFQTINADGTVPLFCPGLPKADECVGSDCNVPKDPCTGPRCNPPERTPERTPDSGTCDPSDFIEDARPPRLDPQDAHYDPGATRRWESTNGRLTSYYYRGNYLYKTPRIIEHRIPLAAKFQFNRAGSHTYRLSSG